MASYNFAFKDKLWILGTYAWGAGGESHGFLNKALRYSRRLYISDTPAQKWLVTVPSGTKLA